MEFILAITRTLCEVSKVYQHYATPGTTAEKAKLEIPEPKKRVKLNASRRDSGIGYSSEENSPTQSPLPTNEIKFKLPATSEIPKRLKKDKVDQLPVCPFQRFKEAHR